MNRLRISTYFLITVAILIFVSFRLGKRYKNSIIIAKIKSQSINNKGVHHSNQHTMNEPDNNSVHQSDHNKRNKPVLPKGKQGQTKDNSKIKPAIKLPTMALTVRSSSVPKLLKFFYCDLLRSTSLYWSKKLGNMSLILDKESAQDKVLANNLLKRQKSMGINFDIIYEPLPDLQVLKVPNGRSWQYNRQLYSSFIMDHVINADIIAWIDTDVKFITPVTAENIFKDGKLRVKGMNTFHNSWMKGWDDITKIMIGYRMPSDFMTYFPVYIWKDTITNCRKHIIKHMKVKTIEEAFKSASRHGFMSPVNVILSYAYYFERERYDWHIDPTPTTSRKEKKLEDYNKERIKPGNELNSTLTSPDVHVSLHTKYFRETYSINKHAYCAAVNNTSLKVPKQITDSCKEFRGKQFWTLFEFCNKPLQGHLNTWCHKDKPKCVSLIHDHYNHVGKAVKDGTYDLDMSKVKAVEESASEMKIKCPAFL